MKDADANQDTAVIADSTIMILTEQSLRAISSMQASIRNQVWLSVFPAERDDRRSLSHLGETSNRAVIRWHDRKITNFER